MSKAPVDVEIRAWSDYPEAMMRGQAIHSVIEREGDRLYSQFGTAMGLTPPGATLSEVAAALRAATAPRPENWTWPRRPAGMAPSGAAEPVRAAFCRYLETGEPYYNEED